MSYEYAVALRRRLQKNLEQHERYEIDTDGPRAAVAITLADVGGRAGYVFIRRALTLRRNPGQFALPGGGVDAGETVDEAARRELDEEVGVDLPETSVLGLLDDFPSPSGGVITPVVLWAAGAVTLEPNPEEVHGAWVMSVSELDHPQAPRWETLEGVKGDVLRMPVGGEWINPPTAAILYQFREVGLHARTVRVHEVGSPRWTEE